MIYRIKLPPLGETMESGVIAEWHKKIGDYVNKGEPLFSVETDKTTMDVESIGSGYLKEICFDAGEEIPINSVVAILNDR